MKLLLIVLAVLTILSIIGWKTSRFGYETAPYSVIEKDGPFEIREYPAMTLATTTTNWDGKNNDGAFMRLFRYIAKDNSEEQKISMTTPVFMTGGEDQEMSFVVPEDVAKTGAPTPNSSEVKLKKVSMGKVAAYKYSGKFNSAGRKTANQKLDEWLKRKALTQSGDYFSAGYDPPFTPPFLKRNEALVQLSE